MVARHPHHRPMVNSRPVCQPTLMPSVPSLSRPLWAYAGGPLHAVYRILCGFRWRAPIYDEVSHTGQRAARVQLCRVLGEFTEDQAERALTVLEASAEWILTGTSRPLLDDPGDRPRPTED